MRKFDLIRSEFDSHPTIRNSRSILDFKRDTESKTVASRSRIDRRDVFIRITGPFDDFRLTPLSPISEEKGVSVIS